MTSFPDSGADRFMELPTNRAALPSNLRGSSALAAIVFTDVEAFTPKMAANEVHTLGLIHRDFQVMNELAQRYEGLVLKCLGDGLLIYFVSAERAVQCAFEIQKAFAIAASQLPPEDILKHRIGIHLGDVLFSGNDVMGNGVNMAARLQGVSAAGGICISRTVYDVIKNRLSIPITYQGLRHLKGIQEPVPVFQIPPPRLSTKRQCRVFLSYADWEPEQGLAREFRQALEQVGHTAFMAGDEIRLGDSWSQRIEAELKQCDYLLLLLSERATASDLVTQQVRFARSLQESRPDNKPAILPVRVNLPLTQALGSTLGSYLNRLQQREWVSPDDTPNLLQEVLSILGTDPTPSLAAGNDPEPLLEWDNTDTCPPPVAVPELPDGQVDVASVFYVERPPIESRCYETVIQPGALIRIKAPQQMGKTSLMARILHYAERHSYRTVPLNLRLADAKVLTDLDRFLRWFCASVSRRLRLPNQLETYWDDIFGSKDNCTAYFEEYLLENVDSPLVLGLDEVDCVFEYPDIASDFFGLLRAWHEDAKNRDIWKKLRLVVVHATEVYIPMDINQSPFNVGLPVELLEFDTEQVYGLAKLHGINWEDGQVERLMTLVGGHPYLVRLALYHIARQDTTLEELLRKAPTEEGLYSSHLRGHLWQLRQNPDLAAAMREVVGANSPVRLESSVGFKLHSMGLIHLQGNEVTPRCDLYRLYFRDRLSST